MSVKFKICGMRDAANIRSIAALHPDYMGFIFYKNSPRYVGDDFVMPKISSRIKKVGVFVNEPNKKIIEKVKKYKLNAVQLHGKETAVQVKKMKDYFREKKEKIEIIKAFGVSEKFNFEKLWKYNFTCHYFLFDTKTKKYGGSGKTFNWNLLKKYKMSTPVFISGGIGWKETMKLIDLSVKGFSWGGVDINSKAEISPGLKDVKEVKKIRLLVNELKHT